MSEWARTMAFVGVALVLAGAAYLTRPSGVKQLSLLSDQGQSLTPDLTDPAEVKSLEVVSYDQEAAKVRAFKVAFDGKKWVIPSESNYPADAEQKVGQAAGAFVGLTKERVVTDDPAEHARLGVLDPDDEKAIGTSGRGTRVSMRDSSGKVVADVVLGTTVARPDEAPGAPSRRYVRLHGRNRVYVTSLEAGFSTRFTDWVQTDLLEFRSESARNIRINRYRINETTGEATDRSQVMLDFTPPPPPPPGAAATAGTWTMDALPGGPPASGEYVNPNRINEMTQTLAGLRLIGVRPKPPNLAKALAGTSGEATLSVTDQASLNLHGFYLGEKGGRLFASEGELHFTTSEGVVYSLWLGVVAADADKAAAGGHVGGNGDQKNPDAKAAESRYVMVTASFDPALVPEPAKPKALADFDAAPPVPPAAPDAPKVDDPQTAALRRQYEQDVASWKQRVETGKAKAEKLSRRFADWYYLIDAGSLARMRPSRAELLMSAPPPVGTQPPTPAVMPPALEPGQPTQPPE